MGYAPVFSGAIHFSQKKFAFLLDKSSECDTLLTSTTNKPFTLEVKMNDLKTLAQLDYMPQHGDVVQRS